MDELRGRQTRRVILSRPISTQGCQAGAASPVLVWKAGFYFAGEQVPDVHSGVGRPGGQEAAVRTKTDTEEVLAKST